MSTVRSASSELDLATTSASVMARGRDAVRFLPVRETGPRFRVAGLGPGPLNPSLRTSATLAMAIEKDMQTCLTRLVAQLNRWERA